MAAASPSHSSTVTCWLRRPARRVDPYTMSRWMGAGGASSRRTRTVRHGGADCVGLGYTQSCPYDLKTRIAVQIREHRKHDVGVKGVIVDGFLEPCERVIVRA